MVGDDVQNLSHNRLGLAAPNLAELEVAKRNQDSKKGAGGGHLNVLLDAEADRLCNALRYERSAARRDTRASRYERKLQTKAGEVRLRIPKLRQQTFETAIIERYWRRESSVEEALIEM
jgi:transposase-like protein